MASDDLQPLGKFLKSLGWILARFTASALNSLAVSELGKLTFYL